MFGSNTSRRGGRRRLKHGGRRQAGRREGKGETKRGMKRSDRRESRGERRGEKKDGPWRKHVPRGPFTENYD